MFIESNAAYIMLVPLFAPIALAYQSNPVGSLASRSCSWPA